MSKQEQPDGFAAQNESEPQRKKPYQKPDFRFERVFETQALACGKFFNEGQCQYNKKHS